MEPPRMHQNRPSENAVNSPADGCFRDLGSFHRWLLNMTESSLHSDTVTTHQSERALGRPGPIICLPDAPPTTEEEPAGYPTATSAFF